jgi:acetyltransferase-like isoleucine patch superfamily enzyme
LLKENLRKVIRNIVRKLLYMISPVTAANLERLNQDIYVYRQRTAEYLIPNLQSCGANVTIEAPCTITYPKTVAFGNNVHIGRDTYFESEAGLTIADNVHIGFGTTILTIEPNFISDSLPHGKHPNVKPVAIGKNVYIGQNTLILPGTSVGDGAIISPGCVISEDVAPQAIIGAAPGHITGYRNRSDYEHLESQKAYIGKQFKKLTFEELNQFLRPADQINGDIFFVLSTGRSGSQTIARVLSEHPDITCHHEPRTQIIRLATEYAHNVKPVDEIRCELQVIYGNSVYPHGKYGESDHRFWNLAPLLNEMFPQAKFIWLIRDGQKVISSWQLRRHYKINSFSEISEYPAGGKVWYYYNLLGNHCGAFSDDEWKSMDSFQRNAWYWSYLNRRIQQDLQGIPAERWRMVKLENFEQALPEIQGFLGVEMRPLKVKTYNASKKIPDDWTTWTTAQRASFERYCGAEMDCWYPDWREKNVSDGTSLN